ncbi:MAG: hypothetical protein J7K77_04670 [Dehalococcoidales bacterium]|nr:hypothetical protein [Dehalococcoidales bacterium]
MDNQRMRVMCAWCGRDMGAKDGRGITGVSHGLCEQCRRRLELSMRGKLPSNSL